MHSSIFGNVAMLAISFLIFIICVSAGQARYDENQLKKMGEDIAKNRIEHVVVLMLENRSFDHILGKMNQINKEIDGLKGDEINYWNVTDKSKGYLKVVDNKYWRAPLDPEHTILDNGMHIFGTEKAPNPYPKTAPMNGFVQDAYRHINNGTNITECRQHVMSTWPANSLPITHTLAKEFAVFDRWFASMPGPTLPNRQFLHSATSNGVTDHLFMKYGKGYGQKTIYSHLNDKKIDWKIYFHDLPLSLTMRELRHPRNMLHIRTMGRFYQHVRQNKLPKYSLTEPSYHDFPFSPASDNHPPHDSAASEKLIKRVYEALRNSKAWEKTLLILTYDEHGGYYDHVPTPLTGVPSPDGIVGNAGERGEGFRFDRLGIRVPTILISPWISRGSVFHEPAGPQAASQFEHSSIPGFLKRHFKLDNYLTKRDEWAGAIEPALVQLKSPRMDCPLKLPEVISGKWVPNSPIGSNDDGEEHVGPEDPISADEGYLSTEARLIGNEVKDLLINIRNRDKTGQPDV